MDSAGVRREPAVKQAREPPAPPARAPLSSRAAGKLTGAGLLVDTDAASRRNARRRAREATCPRGNVRAAA